MFLLALFFMVLWGSGLFVSRAWAAICTHASRPARISHKDMQRRGRVPYEYRAREPYLPTGTVSMASMPSLPADWSDNR